MYIFVLFVALVKNSGGCCEGEESRGTPFYVCPARLMFFLC